MAINASVTSPADLANVALRRIGYKLRVGSLYEGSFASKQILDIYAQTRDELLRQNDWQFAERNTALTLLKQAPANGYVPPRTWTPATDPPLNWAFEYQYPNDCLKVRSVKAVPILIPNFDPQPVVYGLENDNNFNPAQKVILANIGPSAVLVYTGQVTDPTNWEADFSEAFAATLGRRLVPVLVGLNALQAAAGDEMQTTGIAEMEQG